MQDNSNPFKLNPLEKADIVCRLIAALMNRPTKESLVHVFFHWRVVERNNRCVSLLLCISNSCYRYTVLYNTIVSLTVL